MTKYYLLLTNPSDGPDYEDEVTALDINEAAKMFIERMNARNYIEHGWDWEELIDYISEEEYA